MGPLDMPQLTRWTALRAESWCGALLVFHPERQAKKQGGGSKATQNRSCVCATIYCRSAAISSGIPYGLGPHKIIRKPSEKAREGGVSESGRWFRIKKRIKSARMLCGGSDLPIMFCLIHQQEPFERDGGVGG